MIVKEETIHYCHFFMISIYVTLLILRPKNFSFVRDYVMLLSVFFIDLLQSSL